MAGNYRRLRALHERDDHARLPAGQVSRLRRILFRLQETKQPADAAAPGFRLHPLKGDRAGQWSVPSLATGAWCGSPMSIRFSTACDLKPRVDTAVTPYP